MARFLYTALYYCLTPFLFLRLLIKHQKSHAYKEQRQALRLAERLGFFTKAKAIDNAAIDPIWFHTVSVGEFIATLPLIRQIMQDYPQYPLLITCTTTTGSAQIIKTFSSEIQQAKIFHVYLPYDLPGAMRLFLKNTHPHLAIIMETEIWPNLLVVTQQMEIPIWLLNARLSARSAKGYTRIKGLIAPSLKRFTGIAAQDELDAQRLTKLGADTSSLTITGSIKFDIKLNDDDIQMGKALRRQLHWQDKKVLIAASTHQGEDEILLRVYQALKQDHADLVLIIVPRHPERFQAVYQLLNVMNTAVLKRSTMKNESHTMAVDILLGDSMGEMIRYFSCADLVFMGGSMVETGGHNILEPAAMGLPIVYGPYMFNFNAINDLFLNYHAAKQVPDEETLKEVINLLLTDKALATQMGQQGKQLVEKNRGSVDKMISLLKPYL